MLHPITLDLFKCTSLKINDAKYVVIGSSASKKLKSRNICYTVLVVTTLYSGHKRKDQWFQS